MKENNAYAESYTASLYGRETYYDPGARIHGGSPVPSKQMYSNYGSGRNTPMAPYTDYQALPNDAELEQELRAVLRTADLNSVTKKDLRRHLEEKFNVDLSEKKSAINAIVDRLLSDAF